MTKEEFIEKAEKKYGKNKYDFSIMKYKNLSTSVQIKCLECGLILNRTPGNFLNNGNCKHRKQRKSSVRKTTEQFIKEVKKIFPQYDYSITEYKKATEKISFICPEHGIQHQRPNDMLNKKKPHGCPACGNRLKNKGRELKIEDVIKRSKVKWEIVDTEIINENTPIKIRCSQCKKIQSKTPLRIIHGKCNYCSESIGTSLVRYWLEEHNIDFIREQTFKECRYKNMLPFDFYLPKLGVLIEVQGEQHLNEVKFFHKNGHESFEERLEKDRIKKEFAETNYKFIEIFEKDFSNLDMVLSEKVF